MLKLPYGVSNFDKVAREDYYFVDHTPYLAQLEQMAAPYLFFLRPRRFIRHIIQRWIASISLRQLSRAL